MSDGKKLTIKYGVDADFSKIDQQLRDIMQKQQRTQQGMGSVRQLESQGLGGSFIDRAKETFQRQNQKQYEQLLKLQDTEKQKIERIDSVKSIIQQKDKQSLSDKEKLVKLEEQQNKAIERRLEYIKQIQSSGGSVAGIDGIGGGGGNIPTSSTVGGSGKGGGLLSTLSPTAIIGAIGAIAGSATMIAKEVAQMPRQISVALGSASSSVMRMSTEGQRGLGLEPMLFAEERSKAFQNTMREQATERAADQTISIVGTVVAGLAGAGYGALKGSAIGPLGTLLGGITGGVVGAGGAMMANRKGVESVIGTERYKSMLTKESFDKMEQMEQGERLRNFDKFRAYDFMGEQMGNITQLEGMGSANATSDLRSLAARGMTAQQGLRLIQQQQQTSGRTGFNSESLQELRNLELGGLTNAGELSGKLQGTGKTSNEAKRELIEVFSEGTRLGINNSAQIEELKRFSDMAVQIAYQSGGDASNIARELASGVVGDPNARNLQATMSAFQMRNETATNLSGFRGGIKQAFGRSEEMRELLGDDVLNDPMLMSSLLGMPLDQMTEDNPHIMKALKTAKAAGKDTTFEDLKKQLKVGLAASEMPLTETRDKFSKLQELTKGMSPEEINTAIRSGEGDIFENYQQVQSSLEATKDGFRGLARPEKDAFMFGFGEYEKGSGGRSVFDAIEARGSGSVTGKFEQAKAKQQELEFKRLEEYMPKFIDQAEKMGAATGDMAQLFSDLKDASKAGIEGLKAFGGALKAMSEYSRGDISEDQLRKAIDQSSLMFRDSQPTTSK